MDYESYYEKCRREEKERQQKVYDKSSELIDTLKSKGIIGKQVQLEVITAYEYRDKGSIIFTFRPSWKDDWTVKSIANTIGIIVGYKLKNVDTVELEYLKATYTEDGISYNITKVAPGEEFIVTRHELEPLMVLNGKKLSNGLICSMAGYGEQLERYKLPYIRAKDRETAKDSRNSFHSSNFIVKIAEKIDSETWKLKAEYKDAFYWVDMEKYMKSVRKRRKPGKIVNTISRIDDKFLADPANECYIECGIKNHAVNTDREILITHREDCDFDLSTISFYKKNLIVKGNMDEGYIKSFAGKTCLLGGVILEETDKCTVIEYEDTIYIYSKYKIVLAPRYLFKHAILKTLDLSGCKLLGTYSISNIFYGANIEKILIEEVVSSPKEDLTFIFDNMGSGTIIETNNKELDAAIKRYTLYSSPEAAYSIINGHYMLDENGNFYRERHIVGFRIL